jgi:hypothetical protein
MDLKKAGCKKQGYCYSKREEARLPLLFLFLNNNDHVSDLIFKFQTLKKYQVDLIN